MARHAASTRVLHLVNGEFYAGAERVQDLLALQLGAHDYDVEFACLKNGIFAEKRQARAATLHALPMRSRVDFTLCSRIASLVLARGIRLLHTHTPRTALLGSVVATMTGLPMVHHVHSPSERDTESGLRNLRNSAIEKLSLRGASRLIAVSSSLERHLLDRGVAAARIRQVPNGVPVAARRRRSFGPGDVLIVGVVALFRPRKGVEILLDAVARLRAAQVPVRLHAVGPFESAAYEESVKALTEALGLQHSVHWAGFRNDVAAEFAHMHVFALPSLFGEGLPMVVLEAMAAGLPVVGTRVEGIPQLIRDGRDGLIVEPGDSQSLANALLRFARLDVNAEALGDSGWQRQRENFSDISMAAGVANIYKEVLNA
jgi:phosphatidyl-myo-inositol alpha-mannosyltransferase